MLVGEPCFIASVEMNLLPRRTSAFFLLTVMLVGFITGCGTKSLPPSGSIKKPTSVTPAKKLVALEDETGELSHQGRRRTYYIHTPKSYNAKNPLPLVLAFHGYGSQGKDLANNTGFNELADRQKFIIVYPDGLDRRWDVASNGWGGVDDVSFVSALIDHLTQIRAIDRRRIYASGVSNGGFLVQRLACEQNSQIAAFASVAATFAGQIRDSCHPPTPISMLMINGTDDRKVPWNGGSPVGWYFLSVPDTINFWRQHNGCTASSPVKQLPSSRVEIARYASCRGGSEVELVTLKGVGHVWPRGGSGPSQLVNGSQEIWNFFQRHQLPK